MSLRRDEVMQTTELLEQILLHLDLRTLLTAAKRVNRHWENLISASPTVQKALFFQPCDASEVSEPRLNPLLQEVFPFWLKSGAVTDHGHLNKSTLGRESSRFLRPEASWRYMLPRQPPVSVPAIWRQFHAMGGDSHTFSLGLEPRSRPPGFHDSAPAGEDGPDKPSPPLQMRDIYDITVAFLAGEVVGSFSIFWDPTRAEESADDFGRGASKEMRQELREVASRADIVMKLCCTVQCSGGEWDTDFADKFVLSDGDAKPVSLFRRPR
ncbi:hypothetical protein GQ53DRAFT_743572 [Thozetella sp. PMI_491]|nr:hypothetical protein GQ53DRAFT_743572 [Thozetella sp. PMI_491]